MRPTPSRFISLLLFAFFASLGCRSAPPNMLFLLADDYCFQALHALGDPLVDTPNLDRLVARGTTFTHAYNMGSWTPAVCIASRSMLLTGRSLWQAQRVHGSLEAERARGSLWPQLMAASGYHTFMTGKWHLPVNAAQTFDQVAHVRAGMPKDTPEGYGRPVEGQPDSWNPADPQFGGYWEGGSHWSEVTADDTVAFLQQARKSAQPFFIYCAFNAPHDPRQAPQLYLDRYPPERIPVPVNALTRYPYAEVMGAGASLRDERLAPFPRTDLALRTHRREYYALITHLDAQIGRIIAELEAGGQAENTWIFFTADHGLAVGQHGLMGKQNLYEHSVRVPFVVVGPGVKPNHRIETPIYLQDVMPTTLELAGVAKPDRVFFHSLLPFIRDDAAAGNYPEIYGAYLKLQRSLQLDGYKLILYPAGKVVRLFRLADDPHEMKDLAGELTSRPILRRLFVRLVERQCELGDLLDLVAIYPGLEAELPLP